MAQINWYESLVVMTYRHASQPEDYEQELKQWDIWLENAIPFCMMRVFTSPEAVKPPSGMTPEMASRIKAWREKQRPAMAQYVKAMALVFTDPASYERMKKLKPEKLFGAPGATFADTGSALKWLHSLSHQPNDAKNSPDTNGEPILPDAIAE